MVNRGYSPYSDPWDKPWEELCHQARDAVDLDDSVPVKPNYFDREMFRYAPYGYIRARYDRRGTTYATVWWARGGSAEIPLACLTRAG